MESQEQPNTETQNPKPDAQVQAEVVTPEKTFTQAELNAIIAKEKAKAARSAKEELEAERKKADLSEIERLKVEREEYEKRAMELEQRATVAERKAALTGKVRNVDAALKLLDDSHIGADGKIDVDAFLSSYDFLKPIEAPTSPSVGGPNPAGGGGGFTWEKIKKMTPAEVNANWKQIQETLKG